MNKISIIISFVLLISFSFSCRRNVFNPSIPPMTEFVEDPIANLSIPSKDATVKVMPIESSINNTDTSVGGKVVYGHFEHYFEFNGHYYLTAAYKYTYNNNNEVIWIANNNLMEKPNGHILEIDVNDNFKMKEVNINLGRNNNEYTRIAKISQGNAYKDSSYVYVQDSAGGNYFKTSDFKSWTDTLSTTPPTGTTKMEAVDLNRVQITADNGVTYTYVYTGGGLQFSIQRLDDRMKQLAQRLETKFTFNEEDFNNHHMFDIGINTSAGTAADFRINPTEYIENDTNYVWIGKQSPHQIWLMPVKKDGKDYLIRFVEHCNGGGAYTKSGLQTEINKYKTEAQNALSKALAAVASDKPQSEIEQACYESIKADANYKVNQYFYDVATKMGGLQGNEYISPNKALTHYVIEFINIK
ncbi:hypothetical protein [Brachyspira murdochii]|uniref:hypothetical protein n=1 Tax=Brachyspira murdochii TaxID=84378 RepID=UPI0012F4DD09|nr:hypothetical protein [Brachyspira murdochii]